jgi:hypothetical protein
MPTKHPVPDPCNPGFEIWVETTLGFDSHRPLTMGADLDGVLAVVETVKNGLSRNHLTRELVPAVWRCLKEIGSPPNGVKMIEAPPWTAGGVRRSVLDDAIFELEELEHVSTAASGLKFALWHVVSLVGLRPETLVPSDLAPRQLAGVSKAGRQTSKKRRTVKQREQAWTRKLVGHLEFATVPSKLTVADHLSRHFINLMKRKAVPREVASLQTRYKQHRQRPRKGNETSPREYFTRRFYDLIPRDFASLLSRRRPR